MKDNKIKEPTECRELLIDSIKEQMHVEEHDYDFEDKKSAVLVVGVNGVGKTTSIGKLAGQLKGKARRFCLRTDTFRAYY